jgi:REP element-mobilizing transposase RayT
VAQSLSNILLHIVFSTKERRPLIRPEIEDELYPYLSTVASALGCPALAVNGTSDHVLWGEQPRPQICWKK